MAGKTYEGWDSDEWQAVVERLDRLTFKQLKTILDNVGIVFGESTKLTNEDIILVLDEADPTELYKALERQEQA